MQMRMYMRGVEQDVMIMRSRIAHISAPSKDDPVAASATAAAATQSRCDDLGDISMHGKYAHFKLEVGCVFWARLIL